jgi:hypothetical protein
VHYRDRQCRNYDHNTKLCNAMKQRLHAILLPALKRRQLGIEICELDHAQLAKVTDAAQSSILIDNDGHICHVLAPEPCRHRCGAVCSIDQQICNCGYFAYLSATQCVYRSKYVLYVLFTAELTSAVQRSVQLTNSRSRNSCVGGPYHKSNS